MNTQIYYFSGTGNSLHAAIELQKRIPDTCLSPIVAALKDAEIEPAAHNIGLIFPLHFFTLPYPVEQFLKRLNPRKVNYLFIIVTRGGSPSLVFKSVNKILSSKGKSLDALFHVDMPGNCQCSHWETTTPKMSSENELEMQKSLDFIEQIVLNKQIYHEAENKDSSSSLRRFFLPIIKIFALKYGRYALNKSFYCDLNCTGCGICEKVCLSGKITLDNSKPLWQKEIKCIFCFACINYCPVQSIQIRGFNTAKLGRYRHPEINPEIIVQQKAGK